MKTDEVDRARLSPMMGQYMEIKDKYKDTLLFYRLGDFYELFFEDALIASKELELTLTGRVAGLDEKVPMCGVPHHAVKSYIEKVVSKGYKVAICEQLEDPRYTKGMVKRGVLDVISKGTIADLELLDKYSNSYIASLLEYDDSFILTLLDISTGKLLSMIIDHNEEKLIKEILHYSIKEIILQEDNELLRELLSKTYQIQVDIEKNFSDDSSISILDNIKDSRAKLGIKHLYYFLSVNELKDLSGIYEVEEVDLSSILEMNNYTIRNLELVETLRNKERLFSLIWLIDKCKTAMGSRKLKNWLLNPIKDDVILNKRYDMIEKLNNEFIITDEIKTYLDEIYDIERLTGKVTNGSLNGRDLLQLKNSIKHLPEINERIKKLNFVYNIDEFKDIYELLEKSIYENPPVGLKDGSLIKDGYNKELDELKSIRKNGKDFISNFEIKIKEETGIKNLKIGFNKVFGYYIEVSKGQAKEYLEKYGWERRQTLANCERFISPELKEKEDLILNSEEKIINMEYDLFMEVKEQIKGRIIDLRKTANALAEIDSIISLTTVASEYNFVRPLLNHEHVLEIEDGSHPVVEKVLNDTYVKNSCIMDKNINALLITGPNMSGKSTYMRQVAIIIILAQIGSFVPAKKANLPIIDKIFTRIGASDDLVSGRSTFMVEMMEANEALLNATEDSLILFDELGRGTATFDGISLAEAILEYILENIKCKTLFSTHYHELTDMEKKYKSLKNVHVDAALDNGKLVFLHKVKEGSIDKSYGIHVASLANMPDSLINRASVILQEYENKEKNKKPVQLSMNFDEQRKETIDPFKDIDPNKLTPIEALNLIYNLKYKK